MDHAILEEAFPFIFDTANLIVCAEHNISFALSTLFSVFFGFGIRVVEVAVDCLGILCVRRR
jgi:hypothetical protein